MKFTNTALLSLSASTVQAWSGAGHLLVSGIAQNVLQKQSPETITDVENVLSILSKDFPDYTTSEGDHQLVECTTYADDFIYRRGGGGSW